MKICVTSDLHGYLPEIEPCELLLICGDIVSLKHQRYSKSCKKWYTKVFQPWINNLPCDKILFIPGNHEVGVEGHEDEYRKLFSHTNKATILLHDYYEYLSNDGIIYKIFGTPYCKIFGNWAYMKSNSDLRQSFKDIPNDLDILISHDAPYGISDIVLQSNCSWYDGKTHLGNIPLREVILEKKPKIVVHGHIHSSSREFESLGSSKVINCSIVNEDYSPIYAPIIFEL